mgnify:CR=1 FL=1
MNAPVAAPGMNKQWVERRAKAVSRGISAGAPVIAAKAENSEIWDVEGNRYIDFGGGIAVVNTGHRHPLVMKRVYEQLEAFTHTCAMVMPYAPFIEVCEKLNAVAPISGEKKSALVPTGAEAVENAVKFARAYPDRFVQFGISEQNMVSVAVGLSAAGKIPFVSTFAKFLTRGYDQIEMAMNSGANLKLVGSHAGISLASDGPSQMALPDVAWFRSLSTMRDHRGNPGCYILQPSDAYAAYALTLVMAEYQGMCYMRTFRPEVEFLYNDSTVFNLGKFEVLNEGRDLLIVSAGYMVHECNKAIALLDRQGIDATLVDLYSIPFDSDALLDLANQNGGNILVVEDNYGGAMGSAVADACTESGDAFTLHQMFVQRIPKSARTEDEVLRMCGLHATQIAARAAKIVGVGV